jgi:S-adenosylmethionine:tRNA ribosyltransferase-isomerase
MKLSEFDYNLPNELIATHPVEPRDAAKLLYLNRQNSELRNYIFKDLVDLLREGDVLVLNNTKVIPARIFGETNKRTHEVLLVKQAQESAVWECWIRGGGKLEIGEEIVFGSNLVGHLVKRDDDIFYIKFNLESNKFYKALKEIGEMPIPPYILKARQEKHDEVIDSEDYQTVFAKKEGSVAAPTASLHFTDDLLLRLTQKGVQIEYVTLHVGLGTFEPVKTDDIEEFQIHSEYFEIDINTAKRLNEAKMAGKRIIAVGTTSVRVLESAAVKDEGCGLSNPTGLKYQLLPSSGDTNIYIYPGYKYRFVDGIITNFHLPKSSLLLLVSAFLNKESIIDAYNYAIDNKYRFYSYGDAMLII